MARVSSEYLNEKKSFIIETTKRIIETKSMSSITMQDIIDASGLSQGGIYRYYKNIDEILADVVAQIRIKTDFKIEIDDVMNKNICLRKKINDIFDLIIKKIMNSEEDILKFSFNFIIFAENFPERAKRIFKENSIQGSLHYLSQLLYMELKELEEKGEWKSNFSYGQICAFVSASFDGIQMNSVIARKYVDNIEKYNGEITDVKNQLTMLREVMLMMLGV